MSKSSKEDWQQKVDEELRGESLEDLSWKTLEGITVKPLYTAEDLEEISHLDNKYRLN